MSHPNHTPTPSEIAEQCRLIRAGWDEAKERQARGLRQGDESNSVTIPTYDAHQLDLEREWRYS